MKITIKLFIFIIIAPLMLQKSYGMSKKQELQLDILVLDATMSLAISGAEGGVFAAREYMKSHSNNLLDSASTHAISVEKVNNSARSAALASLFQKLSHDPLELVSKPHTPWWEDILLGRFASHVEGFIVARQAANRLAQSPHPDTWGPDLLWKLTTEAATEAILNGESEENIGRVAAGASWRYVLNRIPEIRDSVRGQVTMNHLVAEFDSGKVLRLLKEPLQAEYFIQGLPEAQDFYRVSVLAIEQKMQGQHLAD